MKSGYVVIVALLSVFLIANVSFAQHTAYMPAARYLLLASSVEDGRIQCLADGGTVQTETAPDGTTLEVCEVEECYTYDDGQMCQMHRCELEQYADGICRENEPDSPPYQPDQTVRSRFHTKVVEIMSNVENTGYSHNKDHNFSLVPDYTEIQTSHDKYNLFLDCSGFVGYYVIQGLAQDLYDAVTPSEYACQDRPLAADFADKISNAPQVDGDHPAATMEDMMNGSICWGQVEHVHNIKPGDVIVYKHPANIEGKDRLCADNRTVYNVSGNTGHILFAHGEPYQSSHCKDNSHSCSSIASVFSGNWQYGVKVADSTTSPHMHDSRKLNSDGHDRSDYEGNKYHAWTAGENGTLERCDNGTYHRDCSDHGSVAVETIRINTIHENNPTGIGVGTMYISPDRKSYRTSYKTENYFDASGEKIVFIGRPIVCSP